jgi:tetratricopeptide (TPR) repeat protein
MHPPVVARLLLAALLALLAPALLRAQQPAPARKEITEATSTALGRLRPLLDAKDYPAALALVSPLLASAPPDSYDTYVLAQLNAQILLTQGRHAEAIPPLETALRIADTQPALADPAATAEQLYLLAQLHYQRAAEAGTPAARRAGYLQAISHAERRLATPPSPGPDIRLFAASLHYQLATLDPAKPDPARIQQAITHVREGLLLAPAPSGQLLLLLAACHLQLGQNTPAAEHLEILLARDPANPSAWSQLLALYLDAAADTRDPAAARRQNLRALHTLERAQARNHLATPRDHYTRVAILFNIRQYDRAAALLETGLADGSLENTKRNWELLASAYQQLDQPARALDALARATARFPADGPLEFSLAQFLQQTGDLPQAYDRARSALAKNIEKPGQVQIWLAYLAHELGRHQEAKTWIDAARASGDVPATTLDPLAAAIAEALRPDA